MSKGVRIFLFVLAGIVLLVAGGLLYIDLSFEKILKDKLQSSLYKASGLRHAVSFDSANIRLFETGMSVHNLAIKPEDSVAVDKKKRQPDTFRLNAHLTSLQVNGFSFWSYLFGGKIAIDTIHLNKPDIDFVVLSKDTTESKKKNKNKDLKLVLNELDISSPTIDYTSLKGEHHHFEGAYIRLQALDAKPNKENVLTVKNEHGEVGHFAYNPPGNLYRWEVNKTQFHLGEGSLLIDSVRLIPNHTKDNFARQVGHQKTRLDMTVGRLRLSNWTSDSLFAGDSQVRIGRVDVDGLDLGLYSDQRLPDQKKMKEMPQARFKQINTPIRIDSLLVNGSRIVYEEYKEGDEAPGRISFNNLSLKGGGITNKPGRGDSLTVLDVQTRFMDDALMAVRYELDMLSKDDRIHINGSLSSCDMTIANPMLIHAANVKIAEGRNNGLYFNLYLNKNVSHGDVRFLYEDLNVIPLGKDEDAGLIDHIKGFIADNFILKKHNPSDKGDDPRVGNVSYSRVKHKSIFNYSWKSLLTGLRESMGVPKKKEKKKRDK